MAKSTWTKLTADLGKEDEALFTAYRDMCLGLGKDVEERVHATQVAYAVKRVFTSAYIKSHYLEIAVDLLREAEHPALRASFHTTKKVITHRLTVQEIDELDDQLRDLLVEPRDTVGPGTR